MKSALSKPSLRAKSFQAATISYDGEHTPQVSSASFAEELSPEAARLIRRTALRYGVPVRVEPLLTEKLARNESGELPQELFQEVAELLLSVRQSYP